MKRKLRVLTKEYKERRYERAISDLKHTIKRMTNTFYNNDVIIEKLERIEGNDIVRMLGDKIQHCEKQVKKIVVSGRIGKKIGASDVGIFEGRIRTFPSYQGEIGTIHSIPVINNGDYFTKKLNLYDYKNRWSYLRNPTGEEEWMREIELVTEE